MSARLQAALALLAAMLLAALPLLARTWARRAPAEAVLGARGSRDPGALTSALDLELVELRRRPTTNVAELRARIRDYEAFATRAAGTDHAAFAAMSIAKLLEDLDGIARGAAQNLDNELARLVSERRAAELGARLDELAVQFAGPRHAAYLAHRRAAWLEEARRAMPVVHASVTPHAAGEANAAPASSDLAIAATVELHRSGERWVFHRPGKSTLRLTSALAVVPARARLVLRCCGAIYEGQPSTWVSLRINGLVVFADWQVPWNDWADFGWEVGSYLRAGENEIEIGFPARPGMLNHLWLQRVTLFGWAE